MKAGWEVKPLGEVAKFHYGKALPKPQRDPNGAYPVLGANGPLAKSDHYLIEGPALIVGRKGSVGEVTRIDGKCWPTDVTYFTEHDQAKLDFDFFQYALSMLNLPDLAKGVKPGLNRNEAYALPIPLPPLEEQKRIVAVLDAAFEGLDRARTHIQTNLQNARELFGSLLLGLQKESGETWQTKDLMEVVAEDCKLSYGIVQPGEDVAGGQLVVRPVDLGKPIIEPKGLKTIDPAKAEGYARTELKGGELLLCVRGTTGVVSIASSKLKGANVTRGIVPINMDVEQISQQFGYYAMISAPVQKQIQEQTYGAALQQINIRDVRKLEISFPSKAVQEAIVSALDRAFHQATVVENSYTTKLADLDDLRQSLLQKAFAGELT